MKTLKEFKKEFTDFYKGHIYLKEEIKYKQKNGFINEIYNKLNNAIKHKDFNTWAQTGSVIKRDIFGNKIGKKEKVIKNDKNKIVYAKNCVAKAEKEITFLNNLLKDIRILKKGGK